MVCAKCGSYNMAVVDSREREGNVVKRRRKCKDCGNRMTFYEFEANDQVETYVEWLKEHDPTKERLSKQIHDFASELANG